MNRNALITLDVDAAGCSVSLEENQCKRKGDALVFVLRSKEIEQDLFGKGTRGRSEQEKIAAVPKAMWKDKKSSICVLKMIKKTYHH